METVISMFFGFPKSYSQDNCGTILHDKFLFSFGVVRMVLIS